MKIVAYVKQCIVRLYSDSSECWNNNCTVVHCCNASTYYVIIAVRRRAAINRPSMSTRKLIISAAESSISHFVYETRRLSSHVILFQEYGEDVILLSLIRHYSLCDYTLSILFEAFQRTEQIKYFNRNGR